jgi:galactokinase
MRESTFFLPTQSVASAFASGKIDLMGGLTEYSGTLALQLSLSEGVEARAAFRSDNWLRIYSVHNQETYSLNLEPFRKVSFPESPYAMLQNSIKIQEKGVWSASLVGGYFAMCYENRLPLRGMDIWINNELPIGQGLATRTAIQVAVLKVIGKLYLLTFNKTHLPYLVKKADHLVLNIQSGLIDPLGVTFGVPCKLLPVICQPDRVYSQLDLPPKLYFWAIQTGERMSEIERLKQAEVVRTASFMGYSLIAKMENIDPKTLADLRFQSGRTNLPYNGYLSEININVYVEKYKDNLPDKMSGEDFINECSETIDNQYFVDKNIIYNVKKCTSHAVAENFRSRAFLQFLGAIVPNALEQDEGFRKKHLSRMGSWLYESHESYASCGLSDDKSDLLFDLAKKYGANKEVYGAKITGKGIGGTVCIMTYGDQGIEAIYDLHQEYCERVGEYQPVFKVTSQIQ